jgi:hypothetical protein
MPAASIAASAIIPQVKYMFQHQADIYLNKANPIQNTWYTVLPATDDVRIIGIGAAVQTAGEDIEGRITIDGIVIVASLAFVAATSYAFNRLYEFAGGFNWRPSSIIEYRSFLQEGQNIKFEIRKTSNAGNGNLQCKVQYDMLLPT